MYSSVIWESLFISCIFPIGVWLIDDQSMRKKKKKKKKTKKQNKKKTQWYVCVWNLAPLGTYVTFWGPFIGYICHCGFLWDFYMSFHSLSHSCHAFGVSRVHVRVLWYPMLLGPWLICIRYERWVTFLLGSPDHCLISTIPSLVIWLSLIVLIWIDHHSFPFLIALLCISSPISRSSFHFYPFPTYWYTFLFWYLLHINHIFHWWFDYSSFSHFAIDISFGYL